MAGILVAFILFDVQDSPAGDWPQILGPKRNGIAVDEQLDDRWPSGGPPVAWQKNVGQGFSGVAVVDNQVILFHRVDNENVAVSLEAKTGRELWDYGYPTRYTSGISPDSGPRCVPVIHAGHVFLHDAAGRITCLSMKTGDVQWTRDTAADFRFPEGYFGQGSTPIVENDSLIVNVGGRDDSGIVAFDLKTGKTKWRSTNERASYSSPVATTADGVRHLIFVARLNVLSIDPHDGRVRFRIPFGKRGPTVHGANPVVIGRHVFLSSSYGVGAELLRIEQSNASILWNKSDIMSSQYMTSVVHDGVLYGIDGRDDVGTCHLRAIEPITGNVFWTKRDFGMGSILLAAEKLIVVKTNGEIVLVRPSKSKYDELARAKPLSTTTRALPALSAGKLYIRDTRTLTCLDLHLGS